MSKVPYAAEKVCTLRCGETIPLKTRVKAAVALVKSGAFDACQIRDPEAEQVVYVDSLSSVSNVEKDLKRLKVTMKTVGDWKYFKCNGHEFQANQSAFRGRWRVWLRVNGSNGLKRGPVVIHEYQTSSTKDLREAIQHCAHGFPIGSIRELPPQLKCTLSVPLIGFNNA